MQAIKRSLMLAIGLAHGAPAPAVAQRSRTTLVDDAARQEFLITVGPVDLAVPTQAGDGEHGGHEAGVRGAHHPALPPISEVVIPFDVYLHGFRYRVVDAAGRELPAAVLHHLNLIVVDERELFLPISQRLLAVGKETGDQSVPPETIGVPVRGGRRVVVVAMLHNPTGEAHDGVRVELRLAYSNAAGRRPTYVVYPFQMDIGFPAGDKDVDLPPGRSSFSWEGSPAILGRILVLGGHLHEHAESLTLEDVATGEVLWEGLPRYADDGTIVGVTVDVFDDESAIVLDPRRVYRVTAVYHNRTADTLYGGGMGVVGGVFLPAPGVGWPAVRAADPLYRMDRAHYLRQVRGRYADIVRMIEAGEITLDGGETHSHDTERRRRRP